MRDLRRRILQRQGRSGGGRRRHRDGGGHLPDSLREQSRWSSIVVTNLRASKIMQDRARKNPKIKFIWNSAIDTIHGTHKDGVTGVSLKDTITGALSGPQRPIGVLSSRLAISPIRNSSRASSIWMRSATSRRSPARPTPTFPECLPPATSPIPVYSSGRPLPPATGCMAAIDAERWLEANHPDQGSIRRYSSSTSAARMRGAVAHNGR